MLLSLRSNVTRALCCSLFASLAAASSDSTSLLAASGPGLIFACTGRGSKFTHGRTCMQHGVVGSAGYRHMCSTSSAIRTSPRFWPGWMLLAGPLRALLWQLWRSPQYLSNFMRISHAPSLCHGSYTCYCYVLVITVKHVPNLGLSPPPPHPAPK